MNGMTVSSTVRIGRVLIGLVKSLPMLGLIFVGNNTNMELKEHENIAKTATPSKHQHPLSWYIKWISSIILIIGMIFTANNIYPYNLFLHFIGITGWLWVAVLWNDRSLIVLNSVALAIFANGLIAYIL